ncbi:mas-related G-protein coupled receptor member D [Tupaia chinensis]|uniref:Mas-related G-protein coupled receptor member D n=1 Tax=Tupaia chinensis TaxID=246437 RepID=L8Y3I8_TUPCH|nr:mas-related G-protein coupled receptor member D [Tupaia chinensis]ELV09485.1 Mas-related G-protein coupled receptor member D [Tupaia chinensis]
MNQTLNSSKASESALNAQGMTYLAVSSLVMFTCVCGIAGNGVVIWLLSLRRERTPFCVYVFNLAWADLLFLLCMASILCLEIIPLSHTWTRWDLAYDVVRRVKYFAYTASLSLLTAISVQRCISVLFPIWYKCHQPQHLSTVVCTLLWALSFLMNMLASFLCARFLHSDLTQCFTVDMVLNGLIMGAFTPLMVLSSLILFVRVRKSSGQWRRQPMRLYMVILASVFVFLIFSLPLGLYWFVLYWANLPNEVTLLYTCVSRLSSAFSSSANPAIYFFVGSRRSQRLKESLGTVLHRALQEEPELEGRETTSSGTSELGV